MTTAPFESYRLTITPISPIHIGSGDTIEPYEYTLELQEGVGHLVALDLNKFLAAMTQQQRKEHDRLTGGDIVALRQWLSRNANQKIYRSFEIQVQPNAYTDLRAGMDKAERTGEIELFPRSPSSGRAYLPGSSIKGALRTAVVDAMARKDNARLPTLQAAAGRLSGNRWGGPAFEAEALGNLTRNDRPDLYRDPLKQLAVSDAHLPDDPTYIERIQIIGGRKKRTDANDIRIFCEVTWSLFDEEELSITSQLRLRPQLADRKVMGRNKEGQPNNVPFPLSVAMLCRCCNDFYVPRIESELTRFAQICARDAESVLRRQSKELHHNQCIIRIGRHSHFECVTLGEPFHQAPRRGYGTTRSYVQGKIPLGWVKLTFDHQPRAP